MTNLKIIPPKILWTSHSEIKMRQYSLSKSKLLQLLRKPERVEEGIVAGTTALMQTRKVFSFKKPFDSAQGKPEKKAIFGFKCQAPPGEIWLMYKDVKIKGEKTRKVISAWRYPGISKPGESIPIPQDILNELQNNGLD